MRTRILVLARDVTLRAHLARLLKGSGYRVEIAESAAHARRMDITGIAFALVAPEGLGPEGKGLLDELETAAGRPLLIATPGNLQESGTDVFDASDETGLLARIAQALQPPSESDIEAPVLRFAAYCLDLAGHSLMDLAGHEIPLTRSEFSLLREFVQRPGRVLSRDQLLNALAGRDAEAYDRSIDMLVVRLRRKIEPDPKHPSLILTVPGNGYKFAAKVRQTEISALPEPAVGLPETTPAAPERRYVTALAAELVSSDGARLPGDPEELRALIDGFRRYVAAVVARHGGVMAETRLREVLTYFGYPVAQEYAAERAIQAGLALAEHLAEGETALPSGLAVRVGVASGLVIADPSGEVLGETPGEAGRLRDIAEPGQVIIAASTRRLAGELFAYHDLGPLTVKGVAGPVHAWQVLSPSALISQSEALYADALTPLVNREEELTLLLRAWNYAKAGGGRLVLLSGEPGIGKSRLLVALEEELAAEPHASLRYFCSPLHQDSALHPVIARWEQEAGFARADTPVLRLRKLEAVLAPAELPPADVAALLSVPTGERYPYPDLSPQRRKERTFTALLRRLISVTRIKPVLMLFEDAQWADASSLELLDTLLDQLAELPILLIISFRPEFTAPWIGRAGTSLIVLSRLDRRQSATLAAQVTAERVLTRALLDRIVTQTDGVPLFIEELTKAVLEASVNLDGAPLPLAVPGTLQASLMTRLDRLPAAKQVAQIGATIGREFPHVLLAVVAQLPEARLVQGLDELIRSGLVFRHSVPPDAVYTFKHALVQDLAYGTLLKTQRQEIHRRIGEALRDLLADRAEVEPEVVAHHFTQAGLTEPAVEWWRKAGNLAMRGSAFVEAISHLEKALDLVGKLDEGPAQRLSRLRLQIAYGNALRLTRGFGAPEVTAAYERALDIATIVSDVHERFSAYYGLWSGSFLRGELIPM
jgi:DNA-binding response OmpR family regulator/class 3 adenylate cyclase